MVLVHVAAGELKAGVDGKLQGALLVVLLVKPVLHGAVLELAGPALVAGRAVQRVVEEGELHHPRLGLPHHVREGVHHHPVRHRRHAACGELGLPLDLRLALLVEEGLPVGALLGKADPHQAHAAGPYGGEVLFRAEEGHVVPRVEDGVHDARPRGHLHDAVVHLDPDHLTSRGKAWARGASPAPGPGTGP